MFKFKNKLKFGSSNDKQQQQQQQQHNLSNENGSVESTPPPPHPTSSPSSQQQSIDASLTPNRTPSESRKTVSQITNDVSKLSVNDDSPDKQSTLHSHAGSEKNLSSPEYNANHTLQQTGDLHPPTTESNVTTNSSNYHAGSPSSSHPTSVGQATSAASNSGESANAAGTSTAGGSLSASSSPGLLTVKIYGSQNIQLPIKINNNKQILHALAINSSSESVGQQLLKNMAAIELYTRIKRHKGVAFDYNNSQVREFGQIVALLDD